MSHNVGRVVTLAPTRIGPDGPLPQVSANVWEHSFTPQPALGGGNPQFVVVHLTNLLLPGTSRVEVELGYGTDVITAAMGNEAWSRPIDGNTASITIRFVGPAGGATFADYGSGEPTATTHVDSPYLNGATNTDLFFHVSPYSEPAYQPWLECGAAFNWENAACAAGDPVKGPTAAAVGMIINYHIDDDSGQTMLSTCTVTLIDTDLVLTARHCVADPNDLEVRSGSVTFDFQTACLPVGAEPTGYAPRFHKVRGRLLNGNWMPSIGPMNGDWAILQIDPPPAGITPRTLRTTATVAGEAIFAVHHPNGAVKKIQSGTLQSGNVDTVTNLDYSGGSSGSSLFDANGQIIGAALSAGDGGYYQCEVGYSNPAGVVSALANPPAPVVPVDVMLVMDRSGSMAEAGTSGPGRDKMIEARDAASLFVQLVRTGQGHRMGMVSFSSTASDPADEAPANFTSGQQNQLVGASSPYTGGAIGDLTPGGSTSIGAGIQKAMTELTGLQASANSRALLLMTDGMQNTWPMIADVESQIGNAEVHAVGFGSEAQLDGALLSRLAADHVGIYTRANDGLSLKKFFGLCFGNIFQSGSLADPLVELKAGQAESEDVAFDVCEEDGVTVVVGWDAPSDRLEGVITTPGGATVLAGPGLAVDVGSTWWFARIELPYQGEREGTWHVRVRRAEVVDATVLLDADVGEFAATREAVRAFVSIVPTGGPRMRPIPPRRRLYTGDRLSPQVALLYPNGTAPYGAVELTVEGPAVALGALVAEHGLVAPEIAGEPVNAFHTTLQAIAADAGGWLELGSRSRTVTLRDNGVSDDGGMERDGIYGMPLDDVLQYEGTYQLHAIGRYGDACRGQRDTSWSIHVLPGIDAGQTDVDVRDGGPSGGGRHTGTITVTPRDRYGNPLGPGRGTAFDPAPAPGTTMTGPMTDNGDGSYSIPVTWDPAAGGPGLIASQPDRPGVPIGPAFGGSGVGVVPWWCRFPWLPWLLIVVIVILLIVVIVLIVT